MFTIDSVIQKYKKKEFLNIKSYSFPSHGLVIIKGPNACGKTTLIKTMLGLLPYTGTIKFLNRDIKDWGSQLFEYVCYVPQFNVLFNSLTLEDNLYLNNLFLNQESKEYPHTKKLKNMSSGQRKKANLDRSRYFQFLCYIFDEPTTSLDSENKKQFCKFLEKEKQDKLIICVTHDEALDAIADEIIKMDKHFFNERETSFAYEATPKDPFKKRIPLSFYLHILWEEKLISFFKFFVLTALLSLIFLVSQMYSISETQMNETYRNNILNYVYIKQEANLSEDVLSLYKNNTIDLVGCQGSMLINLYKDDKLVPLQVRNVYFSKKNDFAIISDFLLEDASNLDAYHIQFIHNEETKIIPISYIETTSKDKFYSSSGNILDACSYIILPSKALEYFSENIKAKLDFAISTKETIPSGFQYIKNYSDYTELKESYFLPRILCISGIALLGALFFYIELIQWSQKRNTIHMEEKLKIFAAPFGILCKIHWMKEASIALFAYLFSTILSYLIMRSWINKYTVAELRSLHLLSARICYEYFGITFLVVLCLSILQGIILRRRS